MITSTFVKGLELVLVGAGGALGAVLRYVVSGLVQRLDPWDSFPVGTLAVNLIGCAALGLLGGLSEARSVLGAGTRLFVFIGVLGGFTTFSTFTYETLALLRSGEMPKAAVNAVASVLLCLLGAWIGYGVATVK